MKSIIVGAGEVGYHIAERFSKEGHDVTVIDRDPEKESELKAKLNALVVHGSGASVEALEEAGIANADLFVAVADLDEVNLIACLLAKQHKVPKIVARIKSLDFSRPDGVLGAVSLGIDLIINPQAVVVDEICHIIAYSDAAEVAEFAGGHVVFIGYPIGPDSPLAGVSMKTIGGLRGIYRLVVTAITRDENTIIPRGEDEVRAGDLLYFVRNKDDLPAVSDLFGLEIRPTRNVFVLGGGKIGFELSKRLAEMNYRVRLVDRDLARCEDLAQRLERVRVLHTDGTDVETLHNEGIENGDVFIAVTHDDQTNILCSLLAKRHGVKRVIALIDQPQFVTLAPSLGVDVCVSPRLATASAILKFIRRGEIVGMAVVEQSDSEVIEILAPENSPIIGQPLRSLNMPRGMIIGAIVRGEGVIIPSGEDHIEAGDHVVVFALPNAASDVESFFA